jgi:catechol-2,3-dioxygenase
MLDGIDGREVVRESAIRGERKSRSYIDLQRTVMRASESKSGEETRYTVDAKVRVGHVHLKVCRFAAALDFYSGVLGLQITQRYGEGATGTTYTAHSNVR